MKQCVVTILPENISITVDVGTDLIEAAGEANVHITSPCARVGTCNKCLIRIVRGKYEGKDNYDIPAEHNGVLMVLACKIKIMGDIVVEIPQYSRLGKHKVELTNKSTKQIKSSSYFKSHALNPLCKKYLVRLEPPDEMNNISDLERLKLTLKQQFKIQKVRMGLTAMRKLPLILREGNFNLHVTIINVKESYEIVDIAPPDKHSLYALAVDIGTSTVVVSLINVGESTIIDSMGTYNEQSKYGSDVISRIIFSEENPDGLSLLKRAIIRTLNGLISKLLAKHNLSPEDIAIVVCAGNTVMNHLFFKLPPSYLRLEPYVPVSNSLLDIKAREIGLNVNPDAVVFTLPSVSSYVGGDITSGVLATMLHKSEKITLFIDIGTNGEMVLGNNEWMVTCSCSAGPSLEGAGISCGMRAMEGAIDWVEINKETWDVNYRSVGESEPSGICGSGLINAVSEMLDAGVVDRAGNIVQDSPSLRIRLNSDNIREFVLFFQNGVEGSRDIVITEIDIKNFIKAKAAVFAGIRTMLDKMDLKEEVIDRVLIAGGFGNHINISNAINIGLFPNLPLGKFEYVGNTSLQGAATVLLSQVALTEIENIARQMTYIELSIGNLFMEEFVSAMFIPHTDLSLFKTTSE